MASVASTTSKPLFPSKFWLILIFHVPFIKLSIAGLFFLEYIDKNFTYFLYKFDTFQLEAVEAALGHLFSKIVGLD